MVLAGLTCFDVKAVSRFIRNQTGRPDGTYWIDWDLSQPNFETEIGYSYYRFLKKSVHLIVSPPVYFSCDELIK